MGRIKQIEIAGVTYPLNFSVNAAKEVTERYGGVMGINEALGLTGGRDEATPEQQEKTGMDIQQEVAWLLALLMRQGVAYEKLMGGDTVKPLTADEICILSSPGDMYGMRLVVLDAVSAGLSATVETEPDTKNAETTQSN